MSLHLEHLNPEQLAAVTLPEQHALILAGAGSGKTRVLTTRLAWLINNGWVSPAGVLAVTFTNKAAREMLMRLSAMLLANPRGMWIGTFHGLCNRMLRAHHRDAGLPQTFQILDSTDQLAALKRLLKSMNVDQDRFAPRELQWFINASKEQGLRAGDVQASDEMMQRQVELFAAYDEQCQREGVVDFAELLLRSFELLNRNEILRAHYVQRFRHILVDEFQDTNRLQYRWLKLLAGYGEGSPQRGQAVGSPHSGSASLFAVGDDDQSIYAFRGANVGNMADFERDFRVEKVIRLEQNYRSHGHILDAANALIAHNTHRLGKNLWTASGAGEALWVFEAESDTDEARWIVEQVQALAREGMRYQEMAILYRSNAQSRVIEHALFNAGIAYRVYGGLRFFERMEVKHALAYLRLLASPEDDNAFLRVANFPPRGIGARSLEALQDAGRAGNASLYASIATLTGKAANSLGAFRALIESLRRDTAGLPLPEVVEHTITRSGLVGHYQAERDGAERIENLNELASAAAAFASEDVVTDLETGELAQAGPADPLTAFLAHAALEAGEYQAGEGEDALQMMTVHSAKGLEFSAVFISGLEEGLFPHEQSVMAKGGLEEERRLAYVAITRARERLYLSFAQTRVLHGQTRYCLPSRFLEEIPDSVLNWLTPRFAERAARGRASGFGMAGGRRPVAGARPHGHGIASRPAVFGSEQGAGGFHIGQSVAHAKFGSGVIVDAEGQGNDARVQVNFGRQGVKWLAVSIAKLTPA